MENLTLNDSWQWRLGARTRKGVLVVHIVSAGAWIGIDVVMGVLVFTALLAENGDTRALCFRALELVAVWPLMDRPAFSAWRAASSWASSPSGLRQVLMGGDKTCAERPARRADASRVAAGGDREG